VIDFGKGIELVLAFQKVNDPIEEPGRNGMTVCSILAEN
jgi:hypothetical protein